MNKKLGIIVAVIIVLLFLGVGGYYAFHKSKSQSTPAASSGQQKTSGTVFNSIQEALLNHLSLSCDYTSGNMHTVAYIKNGMIRADITNSKEPNQAGSVIMRDKKIYYWNGKTGMMMAMPDITGPAPSESQGSGNTGANTVQNLEQYKKYCKNATVADSEFDVPTDVKFTDQTQMMQMAPSSMMPTGTSGTNYQQQAQQYMQQYHITPQQ